MRNNIQPKRFRNVLSGNAKAGGIWFVIQIIGFLIRTILRVTDDRSPWDRGD